MRVFGLGIPELAILTPVFALPITLFVAAIAASVLLCRSAKRGSRENGYAVAGLICGIAAIFAALFGNALSLLAALGFGIAAIALSRKPAGGSKGLATAALVLGIIGIVCAALPFAGCAVLFPLADHGFSHMC